MTPDCVQNFELGVFQRFSNVDGTAIHVIGEFRVCPFIKSHRRIGFSLFGHCYHADTPAAFQDLLALPQNDGDFGRIKKFEGETRKNRVEGICFERKLGQSHLN